MNDANAKTLRIAKRGIRWWPAIALVLIAVGLIVWVRWQEDWPFQKRNLTTAQVFILTGMSLLLWWTFLSRAPKQLRLAITFGLVGAAVLGAALFRLRGMTGDMLPIIEFRWAKSTAPPASPSAGAVTPVTANQLSEVRNDFTQFLGPTATAFCPGHDLRPTGARIHQK